MKKIRKMVSLICVFALALSAGAFTANAADTDSLNDAVVVYEDENMNISKTVSGTVLNISLEGRLDTTTAPQLEAELKQSMEGITQLELDFDKLEYLSSAGLRVILGAQKTMNKQGKMVVRHVNETIMEVFEVTGFIDILTIE